VSAFFWTIGKDSYKYGDEPSGSIKWKNLFDMLNKDKFKRTIK
jgi:hypothetical protein